MQIEVRQESPLIGAQDLLANVPSCRFDQVRIQEIPFLELTNIRGDSDSPPFMQAVNEALGVPLPIQPNTVSAGDEYVLWWLGPDEWLAQSLRAQPALLEATLRSRFANQFASGIDVSSGYTALRVSGRHARDILQKGCPLDLHPKSFKQGQCAQSVFFKADMTLRIQADQTWIVIVRRSFADYAVHMLLDAAAEFYL